MMRLLLIEDDPNLGHFLKTNLMERNYLADLATNATDAKYLAAEISYDLIILDLGLPDQNGLDLLREWRKRHMHILVLILTARSNWEERVEGFKAGADDYLCKPFHFEELEVRLQALLNRNNPFRCQQLEVAGIQLDEDNQTALIVSNDTLLDFTATEYRLLKHFMLNAGRLRSRQQLLDILYQYGDERDSNIVEAYIRRLRLKLGKQAIETKRMQGYIFRGLA
ncbi:response regulator transcription factor [Marinobacterium jannaschii]|uniref:response regulator transcription factor n=1 Tax=Marinobacterium jannaschii TaxID=64970 RepID=UPI001FE035B5|nr:response regulator transcription factor [Marinobacterium jannaschii]